jgi:GntP family gluconate:H+ symporter
VSFQEISGTVCFHCPPLAVLIISSNSRCFAVPLAETLRLDTATWLLLDTLLAVVGLVLLITWLKLNAFIALAIASLAAGIGAGMNVATVADAFEAGVGDMLGKVAMVIGLGAVLGQMLGESGGAKKLAASMLDACGPRLLAVAVIGCAFLIGIPVFFTVGLVLLVPVLVPLAERAGIRLSRLGLPLVAGLSVSHALVPPHPGPMAAIGMLHADVGKTILYSILIGVPTALVAGLMFARVDVGEATPASDEKQNAGDQSLLARRAAGEMEPIRSPALAWVLLTILLPILLMLLRTLAELLLSGNARFEPLLHTAQMLGDPAVAMLIAVLVSFVTMGLSVGMSRRQIAATSGASLAPIAEILLVVAAGGGFSRVLIASGVGDAILHRATAVAISPLLLGWLATAAIRVATGSATVAITTAAGLLAPLAAKSGVRPEMMVLAMGAGSIVCSHVNDGGFWLVQKYLRLNTPETLRTWTVLETVISIVAFGLTLLLSAAVGPK